MYTIPLQPVPNQSFSVVLDDQNCRINIRQMGSALFLSLTADDVEVCKTHICQNREQIPAWNTNLFKGKLVFADQDGKNHPEYSYFMDAYLYASNRESVALISDILKESLKGAYIAPDFDCEAVSWPVKGTPLNGYKLPIFISRSCFRHDSLGLSCEGCSRHNTFKIEQNGRRYLVTVDNCQSLVKEEPPEN